MRRKKSEIRYLVDVNVKIHRSVDAFYLVSVNRFRLNSQQINENNNVRWDGKEKQMIATQENYENSMGNMKNKRSLEQQLNTRKQWI